MLYLINAPQGQVLDAEAMVASGSGLDWKATPVTTGWLMEYARKNVKFENVELKILSGNAQVPPPVKDKLVYGESGQTRLWIDTKPMASSRFTANLAVVVQEIQSATGTTLGYVVVFPDGRVLKVVAADLIKYCEAARVQGKNAVQNMQYVSSNGTTAAHLKNYEGLSVPIFIQQRVAVNAESVSSTAQPVRHIAPNVSETQPQTTTAASVFSSEQLEVLGRGKKEGVDIRVYANPAYSPKYMDAIRRVLVVNKPPALLQGTRDGKAVISDDMATFYSHEIVQGADVRPYFNHAYTQKQATQVKLGVIRGLDVSKYSDPSISGEEMEQLRVRMDADMWSGIDHN